MSSHSICYIKIILLSTIFLLKSYYAFTQKSTIIFKNTTRTISIGNYVSLLEDPSDSFHLQGVVASNKFKNSTSQFPNLGVSTSSFWVKFKIKNLSKKEKLVLEIAHPILDKIELYNPINEVKIHADVIGEHLLFSARKYPHPSYVFDLNIPINQTRTYLLKIKGSEQIMLPISVSTVDALYQSLMTKDLFFGIYFGIMLVIFLYNFFVYLAVRDKSYLYYVIYILFVALTQAALQGYTFKYLWPNTPVITNYSIIVLSALGGIAAIEFLRYFLLTKQYAPLLNRGLKLFNIIFIISIVLALLKFYTVSFQLVQINTMILSLYLMLVGFNILKKGYRPAKFFLLAWSILLIGAFVFILKDFGILPYNTFTTYAMQISSAIEAILLSFALADRINTLKKEKEESQAKALQAFQENERIIKEQNIILEAKVKERTTELQETNKELNITFNNLKSAQSQLVNAEKMASLGQLTAGIAHEINNPINFVTSNVNPLKRDVEDILHILNKYNEVTPNSNIEEKLKEINKLKKDLDLDYLVEEINSLLSGIEEGASRTSQIVKGLRNFSRLDEDDLKKANINEGLDSTLTLLNQEINGTITLVKDYSDMPSIECFPGKLNQVFMNLLNNAIHAVVAKTDNSKEKIITIKTFLEEKNIYISIKDNGCGIPEAVREKIFDPFFTTKDVGKGTGLGLSIAYSIIESHKGDITFETEVGKGTEFTIRLPASQS